MGLILSGNLYGRHPKQNTRARIITSSPANCKAVYKGNDPKSIQWGWV